jgi:hypothetical protein
VQLVHYWSGGGVVVVAVLLALAVLGGPPAGAAGQAGTATGAETVTSGTWAATASVRSMTFTTATPQTSTIANTGTIALSAVSYAVTVSSGRGAPRFTLYACTAPWVRNRCSGGAGTQVGGTFTKNSTTTVTSAVVPPLGGAVYLRVEPTRRIRASTTVTLSTSVSAPGQLRGAVETTQ